MNNLFDKDAAKQELSHYQAVLDSTEDGPIKTLGKLDKSHMIVQSVRHPSSIRLFKKAVDESEEREELIIKTQGILCGKSLPPIGPHSIGRTPAQLRNLRQHVKITGLSQAKFDESMTQLDEIHSLFQQFLPGHTVLPLDFIPYEGHRSLDSHARYFTDRALVPYETNNNFLPFVDPHHVLVNAKPDSFIHAIDNQVEYCLMNVDEEGDISYLPCNPVTMKPGDLVEIAFICVAIPIKDQRYKLMLQLRAITLISSTLRLSSENLLRHQHEPDTCHKPKRKATFLGSTMEVDLTRKRMNRMRL
ncbi:hypothetical protein BKA70DRAFT_1450892 [Coprinopsis sp. MPI-PUGE-AT-0042]|nr:hypothetical protein BKA70DRAFT_1450892 [Coprinopsis sp. MPI-PUGE-AT-0042]